MALNIIDVLLLLLIALSAFIGWQRGFILSLLDLIRWAVSLLAALLFYRQLGDLLNRVNDWTEVWNQPLAFLLIIAAVRIAIQIGSSFLLRRLPKEAHQKRFNRLLGIIPGLASGIFSAVFLAALLFSLPLSDNFQEKTRDSRLANYFADCAETMESALSPIFGRAVEQTLNRLTINRNRTSWSNCRLKSPKRSRVPNSKHRCSNSLTANVPRRAYRRLPPIPN